MLESLLPRPSPNHVGPLSNSITKFSPISPPHTQVHFSLSLHPHSFHHQKAGQGRVKHLSNPQQGPPHWLGNNGAISLYLTFAPATFMTYSSPPLPAVTQSSIFHPLPEQSCTPTQNLHQLLWPPSISLSLTSSSPLPDFSCLIPYIFSFSLFHFIFSISTFISLSSPPTFLGFLLLPPS